MKLVTFAIPCYNSENYMKHCLDTILKAKYDIEIIIINDGSKDNTKKIAESYRKKYPKIIKVINQENQGHGEGVNQGLKYAEGLYYKVVDSDDWVDVASLNKLLKQIKNMKEYPDMFIVNYVYEKEGKQKVINYKSVLPKNKIFTWNDVKKFKPDQNILMHSVVYKTEVLKNSGVMLPKHTFYVDNIFVYYPLPYINTMYYMDIDLYRYFIGRSDQSVNEKNMVKRIDQQIFITKEMTKFFDPYSFEKDRKKLSKYLIHYLSMMYTICFILSALAKDKTKKEDLLEFLKNNNIRLYKHIKNHSLATLTRLPRFILIPGYRIVNKIYKFN
ncbi:MAG: glycosyltransferase family 2 protein [Firmicutes bacterium]|nr:glycosyltransferase family 2 protein [Bacillota bacterium]